MNLALRACRLGVASPRDTAFGRRWIFERQLTLKGDSTSSRLNRSTKTLLGVRARPMCFVAQVSKPAVSRRIADFQIGMPPERG